MEIIESRHLKLKASQLINNRHIVILPSFGVCICLAHCLIEHQWMNDENHSTQIKLNLMIVCINQVLVRPIVSPSRWTSNAKIGIAFCCILWQVCHFCHLSSIVYNMYWIKSFLESWHNFYNLYFLYFSVVLVPCHSFLINHETRNVIVLT